MTTNGDVGSPRFPNSVLVLLFGLVLLVIAAVFWGVAEDEDELLGPVTEALAGTELVADISGRDVTLSGIADAATTDRAIASVRAVRGVRRVYIVEGGTALITPPAAATTTEPPPTTTTTAPPATTTTTTEAPLSSPLFVALRSGDLVELTGTLPDQDIIDDIEAAAVLTYGDANVVSDLAVGEVTSPGYLSVLPRLFAVTEGLVPWNLSLDSDRINFWAIGPDAETVATKQSEFSDLIESAAGLDGTDLTIEIDPENVATSLTELLAEGANFETGSAQLSADAEERLNSVIEILLANPSTIVTVEGHTDNQGDPDENQTLSEERAQAVVDYLVDGGVAAGRLTAVGFGEDRPIADNGTSDGRAQNRRIDFVVNEGG